MKTLLSVQRPLGEKIALIAIFGTGIFATIVSMIRLYSIRVFTSSDNPTEACIPVRAQLGSPPLPSFLPSPDLLPRAIELKDWPL